MRSPINAGKVLGLSLLAVATACQLLPGAAPTPFPTAAPTAERSTPVATASPEPPGVAGAIGVENAAGLFQIGELAGELTGELAWFQDGRRLALTTTHGIGINDLASGVKVQRLDSPVSPLAVALAPDGSVLVTGGRDLPESEQDTVAVWDLASSTRRQTLTGHQDWINTIAMAPGQDLVASGSDDTTVRLWRVEIGAEATALTGHTLPVRGVAFSPDGQLLASGSLDGSIRLWRVRDGTLVQELRSDGSGVHGLAFSPDGVTLAAGYADGAVRIWAAGTGTLLHTLTGHAGAVNRVGFSPAGMLLASAGSDATVRIWAVEAGRLLLTLEGHAGPVLSVAFSPDGTQLASGSLDGRVRIWGLSQPAAVPVTPEPLGEPIPRFSAGRAVEVGEIHMLGEALGWAFSEGLPHVLRTEDGGLTWIDVTPPEPAPAPGEPNPSAAGFFLDPYLGWVVYFDQPTIGGPGGAALRLWWTTDGMQWQPATVRAPLDINEAAPLVRFVDPDHGWILVAFTVGAGQRGYTLVRSQDGGRSWEAIQTPPDSLSSCTKTGVEFADPAVGWMTNECPFDLAGGVYVDRTDDGGTSWQALELAPPAGQAPFAQSYTSCRTHSPHLFSPVQGLLVVECRAASARSVSYLYATEDAGQTWTISAYPGGALQMTDRSRGWALSRQIHRTENGGQTWQLVKTVIWDGQFSFVDSERGWAVARSEGAVALVRTTNGARTFALLEPLIGE